MTEDIRFVLSAFYECHIINPPKKVSVCSRFGISYLTWMFLIKLTLHFSINTCMHHFKQVFTIIEKDQLYHDKRFHIIFPKVETFLQYIYLVYVNDDLVYGGHCT